MCPRERFSYYKGLFRLVLCYKRIGPPGCTLFTFIACYPLQITLSQNYLLPIILVLAENTLLKTACHFLLLLIGFDTLTYQKDYDRSPTLVGHQHSSFRQSFWVTNFGLTCQLSVDGFDGKWSRGLEAPQHLMSHVIERERERNGLDIRRELAQKISFVYYQIT